jgi:hypothetical protein
MQNNGEKSKRESENSRCAAESGAIHRSRPETRFCAMVIIMMVPPVYVTKEREKNQEIAAAAGHDQP